MATDEGSDNVHLTHYAAYMRAAIGKLQSIYRHIGQPAVVAEKQAVANDAALAAWSDAVEKAEAERQSLKALIQQQSAEIASIRSELDDGEDEDAGAEAGSSSTASAAEGEGTLLRTLDALKASLQLWRSKRAARLQAYEQLMALHVALKARLGIKHVPVEDVDISTGALEYLGMENDKLREEQARRLARAEQHLEHVRAMCRELGEDSGAAAADVHPALRTLSAERESAEALGSAYGPPSPDAVEAAGDLDLSDAVLERLAAKIGELERLKVEREAQSRDLLEMLGSLWSALAIPDDAPERGMVLKMLAPDRPQRLFKRTLDKCMTEVNRLEGCKAQAMRDLAMSKARELEQLCIATRISPPHTGPLLAELDKPGQMTSVLSKLVRLVAEVQAMAAKRGPILAMLADLQAAHADSVWLRAYSADENRYKGRDASRNMQRAIKAGKLRERLGPMMEALLAALGEWEVEEGAPFLYDEQVLQETQLKAVEAELEQVAHEKVPKPRASSTSGAPPPVGAAKPPLAKSASTHGGSAAGNGSSTQRGHPLRSSSAGERPMLTPRNVADVASRRLSLVPAPSSSRESGTFRGSQTAAKLARSNDFTPGALRAASDAPLHHSFGGAAPPPQPSSSSLTPPMRVSAPGLSPLRSEAPASAASMTTAEGGAASGVKNAAADLFKRYLGDGADGSKTTPKANATPKPSASPFTGGKSSFSTTHTPGDDGGDDVRAVGDTPKSAVALRQSLSSQQLAAGAKSPAPSVSVAPATNPAVLSPNSRPSRIPKLRLA